MAQELQKGNISIYFLGQNYGLSILESFSVALFLKVVGAGVWALRLGGLLLFSLGSTFIIHSFQRKNASVKVILFVGLLLILFPSWYLWGMMVRGGYVSSFLFVSVLFFITQTKLQAITWCIFTGILAALAFESHLLVLFTFLPILIDWILKSSQKIKSIVFFGMSVFSSVIILRFFHIDNPVWSQPILKTGFSVQWDQLIYHLGDLMSGFSNYHYFTAGFKLEVWLNAVVIVGFTLFALSLFVLIYKSKSNVRRVVLFFVPILFGYIFLISMMGQPAPRYWLGLFTGLLFLMLYLLVYNPKLKLSVVHYSMLTFFIVLALIGGKHRRDWYQTDKNEMVLLRDLQEEVVANNVDVLYTVEPDFQWKWNYMYGNQIPAMHVNEKERTMKFIHQIDELRHKPNVNIGVVGFNKIYNGLNTNDNFYQEIIVVDEKYFLFLNPSEIELESFNAFYK